jgi:hypothetical protein
MHSRAVALIGGWSQETSMIKRSLISLVLVTAVCGGVLAASASPVERHLTVKGERFLTLNTVIRVNQIEAARNLNEGDDEAALHTPEAVAAFREAVSKGFPGAQVTWAFSWLALHDERPNYAAIRKQVVGYHKAYGDEITFIPGGYFAPMYSSRAQVNKDIKEALQRICVMVGNGYKPKSLVAGFLSAENLRYLAKEEGIHVCQGTIWSQYGIDNGDGDGSLSYPYYPSREHGCKPAQGRADFIDCVNLDGWTCDFLCARRFGFEGGFNSRLGVGPIESYRNLGVEKGMAEVMAVTANHFDDAFERNGFGWVTDCWEISLVKSLKPEALECLTRWLQNVRERWPDVRVVTQGEFGEAWRREHPDNNGLDYRFVQRGTGIGGSEPNLEIRWFMNTDFRLAILRDWKKEEPGKVIDFTRYDLPAREPSDPSPGKPSRNWSLINRINQKHQRPEDAPVPLSALTKDEQSLIRKHYPELLASAQMTLARPQQDLLSKADFANLPMSVRPGAFWPWLNGTVSLERLTYELEEMKDKGMQGADIWDVKANRDPDKKIPAGPPFLGEDSLRGGRSCSPGLLGAAREHNSEHIIQKRTRKSFIHHKLKM